jgi:transcriptional regulator
MPLVRPHVGPDWPPLLEHYDYLSSISWRDWAWEYLRRNPAYRKDAELRTSERIIIERLGGGALLTRMQERSLPAEAWALCSFRRSCSGRTRFTSRLVA